MAVGNKRDDWFDATGHSKGDWMFQGEFQRTIDYLSNHQKILLFNPFCHSVELLQGTENVYKWLFRVSDPQNNPFEVIFFVEQLEELLLDVPKELHCTDPSMLTPEMITQYATGKKITWRHYDVQEEIDDPTRYLFEGKVFADMLMEAKGNLQTRVQIDLRVDVRFVLYPAFRIIPDPVLHAMVNGGMSILMQTATNRMFHAISKDFHSITPT